MRTPENPSLTMNLNNTEEDVIAKMADVSRVRITSQYDALTADIYDFVEEHSIDDIRENVHDIDKVIARAEDLRSSYRGLHNDLKRLLPDEYEEKYGQERQKIVDLIRHYIRVAQEARRKIRGEENVKKVNEEARKSHSLILMINDCNRIITELLSEFDVDMDDLEDEEVSRRLKDVAEINRKVDRLAAKFPEMSSYSRTGDDETKMFQFGRRYDNFLTSKKDYVTKIRATSEERELGKEKLFQESSLNIDLKPFEGYNSKDLYTFKDEFEKLYLRKTPKRKLPELIKNNFLAGAALDLVKHVEDIDEIWSRLKKVYGDPKVMLSKKFEAIGKTDTLARSRDTEKTMESLFKVITAMKDMERLSKKHNIENHLYYGDGLEKILKLIGDFRATKWIRETCEEELTREKSWESLVEFLEKESNVLQQKMLLLGKKSGLEKPGEQRGQDTRSRDDRSNRQNDQSAHTTETTDPVTCSFCGEDDHVATTGPGNTKIVQYYSCKKFADLTPAERFKELRRKGFCYQCLLPGAALSHKDGRCQKEYVCKHESHNRFKMKQHVLVCETHKNTDENKTLLDDYKERCIRRVRSPELPDFSRDIAICFHADDSDMSCHEDEDEIDNLNPDTSLQEDPDVDDVRPVEQEDDQENLNPVALREADDGIDTRYEDLDADNSHQIDQEYQDTSHQNDDASDEEDDNWDDNLDDDASDEEDGNWDDNLEPRITDSSVYILQTISIRGQKYTIFFDNGCKTFCCTIDAVKRLKKKARCLQPGPKNISGVCGTVTKSPHGVYAVKLPLRNGKYMEFTGMALERICSDFPKYPIKGMIEDDIRAQYKRARFDPINLPKLPSHIGGRIDFMVGVQYLK